MQFIKEYKKHIIVSIIILFLVCTFFYYFNHEEDKSFEEVTIIKEEKIEPNIPNKIKVEIKGFINNPGVYELNENSRVIDVINIAGGLKENADTSLINLSKKIKDEMVIIIYSIEEIKNYNDSKIKTEYVYIEVPTCPEPINDACIKEYDNEQIEENKKEEKIEEKKQEEIKKDDKLVNEKVNINTASIEELSTLSGIGESKAKLIIEYRQLNGKFNNINELTNVKGIGESLIEKNKNNITI